MIFSLKRKDFNIEENNKFLEFLEKILYYYQTKKDNHTEYKERIDLIISDLIYLCSELINYDKNQNKKENKYEEKMRKYLESYKKFS